MKRGQWVEMKVGDVYLHNKTDHYYEVIGINVKHHDGTGNMIAYRNLETRETFLRTPESWCSPTLNGSERFTKVERHDLEIHVLNKCVADTWFLAEILKVLNWETIKAMFRRIEE